ncbi:hypothetical protein NKH36_08290, partial [Mesorhizobium sp. M1312]
MRECLRVGMVGGGRNAFIGAVHRLAMRLDDQITLVAGVLSSDFETCPTGLVLSHCGDPARRVEATADSRLPNFDAASSCVVYSHRDRRRECASTLTQGTRAHRVDTEGAKRRRSGQDRRAAGLHDRSWRTGSRSQRSKRSKGIPPGGVTQTCFGRPEDEWQGDRFPVGLAWVIGCRVYGRTAGSAEGRGTCADRSSDVCSAHTADAGACPDRCALRTGAHASTDPGTADAGACPDGCALRTGAPASTDPRTADAGAGPDGCALRTGAHASTDPGTARACPDGCALRAGARASTDPG